MQSNTAMILTVSFFLNLTIALFCIIMFPIKRIEQFYKRIAVNWTHIFLYNSKC